MRVQHRSIIQCLTTRIKCVPSAAALFVEHFSLHYANSPCRIITYRDNVSHSNRLERFGVRIPIAAAQVRSHRIELAQRTTQNFDNRVACRHAMNETTFERPTGLPACSHQRLSKNVVLSGMITSVITEPERLIIHFKNTRKSGFVCITLLSSGQVISYSIVTGRKASLTDRTDEFGYDANVQSSGCGLFGN